MRNRTITIGPHRIEFKKQSIEKGTAKVTATTGYNLLEFQVTGETVTLISGKEDEPLLSQIKNFIVLYFRTK